MTAARTDAETGPRPLRVDLAWTLGAVFALALLSRLAQTPALAEAPVSWAPAAAIGILATARRERRGALVAATWVALAAGLLAGGDTLREGAVHTLAYGVEIVTGASLASAFLARRRHAAAAPGTFALLLALVALGAPLAGASVVAFASTAGASPQHLADGASWAPRWLGSYTADSFALLGLFPFALALRRAPPDLRDRRGSVIATVLVALVAGVTVLSVLSLPRPFAFCSLMLGVATLLAGPRTRFFAVWVCLASMACAALHGSPPPGGFTLAWAQLNLFLPGMAIALPIQLLSVALQRIHHATAVLQRSRERFRRLYDRAPVMLQSLDEQGRTIEVNAQWLATLGHDSADDVRGVPFDHFLAADEDRAAATGLTQDAAARPWHQLLLDSGVQKLHVRLRTAKGHVIHALASAATTPEDRDTSHGVVLAFEDISVELAMRAEIERERDQLAALTSATSDLAVFLDRELRYRSVNRAFEHYWDIPRGSVIGRRPAEVPGQRFFAIEIAAQLRQAAAGAAARFQANIDFPSGTRVMEVALAPAYDASGANAGVVASLHDVTERAETTRALHRLVEELQHANEGLEQFARIAAHDLREPLNTISQFAGLIEEDFGGQLPPEASRYFGLMGKASARMKAMLDDVLQFTRLEHAPQLTLDAVPLDRVFADLRMLLHAGLAQAQADLVIAPRLPVVLGQASLLELLFQNLLSNAMRYTAPGTLPRIAVAAEHLGALVIVTVTDNGIGIPPGELERVFVPFHKLQTYRPGQGSGLGLAICRRIAAALGGRVWAEVPEARGSRLHVALKAAFPPDEIAHG